MIEQKEQKRRISSIDILRGLVMLIMLVDHVRERFFYNTPITDPMNVDETSPALFFTRILTHLCAPTFVFLTGLGAWLYANPKGKAPRSASSFLFKRGLFLILLDITLVNLSWFGFVETIYLQVIWAIGLSMITLALVSKLDRKWVGLIGAIIVLGHNALTPISFQPDEVGYSLWTILHDRGFLITEGFIKVKASYPILPWVGVILLGYYAGPLFSEKMESSKRVKYLSIIGVSCLGLLLLLRGFNIYGETMPWSIQDSFVKSVMSFVNFTKYPPSLDFLLFTLGIAFFLLAMLENIQNKCTEILRTFGNAPMFFYILHLYVLLGMYKICVAVFGITTGKYFSFDHLWQIWLLAVILAIVLYFPTKMFAQFKRQSKANWVKYF